MSQATDSSLPTTFEPHAAFRGRPLGLMDEGVPAVRRRVEVSWDGFMAAARGSDLDAPSRLAGWQGRDILAHLGTWHDYHPLDATLESARNGHASATVDQDRMDAEVRQRHRDNSRDDLLAALERGRAATLGWLDSSEAEQLATTPAATIVGPLPLLTAVQCLCFELAVHMMDLEQCGAEPSHVTPLENGLAAICDASAAIAYRVATPAAIDVQTPDGGWQMSIDHEGWTTRPTPPQPVQGTGVFGTVRDLLDVAGGRANVPKLYTSGRIKIYDLPGFLDLAPLVEHMPGIPNQRALANAANRLNRVNRLLGRRPRRRTSGGD